MSPQNIEQLIGRQVRLWEIYRDLLEERDVDEPATRRPVVTISRQLGSCSGERTRSEMDVWVSGMLERRLFSHDEFHVALVKAVRALAAHGGVVFVGRGANFVLDGTDCLRIRVIASLETRVAAVMKHDEVDALEAGRRIEASDAERAAFVERLFDADWNDSAAYDLVLNTDHLPAERLVDVAVEAVQARGMFAESTAVREAEAKV